MCNIGIEGGDFYREVNTGLQGRRFTPAMLRKIRDEGLEFISAIAEAMARMEGMVDE